ncbi:MAG: shikimate dehydrogenase [Acholeplasmatales bacterium]|nr:shikimate dehydrogenase [Acholeplasmatales bacterium]
MKKYALVGEKLGHSCSPLVHSEIFKDFNLDYEYGKIECSIDELKGVIDDLKNGIYSGYNVTIPYKREVMKYLDEISEEALAIGAVNTVAYKDGKAIGYNSDYYGFKDEVIHFNIDVKNKKCFVLGTGGASLAVHKALDDLGGNVLYVSRNPKNDETISYEDLEKENDIFLIVNTTPVGMYPNVGVSPIKKEIAKKAKYVMDVIFNPRQTQILLDADSKMDGFYMLVAQAVKSEEIWQDRKYEGDVSKLVLRIEAKL